MVKRKCVRPCLYAWRRYDAGEVIDFPEGDDPLREVKGKPASRHWEPWPPPGREIAEQGRDEEPAPPKRSRTKAPPAEE